LALPRPIGAFFGAQPGIPGITDAVVSVSRLVAGQVVDKPTGTARVNAELAVLRIPG